MTQEILGAAIRFGQQRVMDLNRFSAGNIVRNDKARLSKVNFYTQFGAEVG